MLQQQNQSPGASAATNSGSSNPGLGGIAQFQQFHAAALQQQLAANNPNHNEVMSLDPVDGRDLRGRGRSREASNSRIFGLSAAAQAVQQ